MARLARSATTTSIGRTRGRHCRGVVYVEFLIAFIPVFLLFLVICQVVLLTAARVVVSHAAVAAARSAIVVLEDTADDYGGAPRGDLSQGKSNTFDGGKLLSGLGIPNTSFDRYVNPSSKPGSKAPAQLGARMSPIRLAAMMPLLTLAPKPGTAMSNPNLEQNLVSISGAELMFAYKYASATTAVTIQKNDSSDELAERPIDSNGPVTVEVNFIYWCGVPIVRNLACRPFTQLLDKKVDKDSARKAERLSQYASPQWLDSFSGGRYAILSARATLTNQGAGYVTGDGWP